MADPLGLKIIILFVDLALQVLKLRSLVGRVPKARLFPRSIGRAWGPDLRKIRRNRDSATSKPPSQAIGTDGPLGQYRSMIVGQAASLPGWSSSIELAAQDVVMIASRMLTPLHKLNGIVPWAGNSVESSSEFFPEKQHSLRLLITVADPRDRLPKS